MPVLGRRQRGGRQLRLGARRSGVRAREMTPKGLLRRRRRVSSSSASARRARTRSRDSKGPILATYPRARSGRAQWRRKGASSPFVRRLRQTRGKQEAWEGESRQQPEKNRNRGKRSSRRRRTRRRRGSRFRGEGEGADPEARIAIIASSLFVSVLGDEVDDAAVGSMDRVRYKSRGPLRAPPFVSRARRAYCTSSTRRARRGPGGR